MVEGMVGATEHWRRRRRSGEAVEGDVEAKLEGFALERMGVRLETSGA